MSEARQKPFHDHASQEPIRVNMPNLAVDVDETHLQSPFSAGSRRYPVSAAALQDTVQSLLPDAKKWLRAAFDKCQNVSEQDRPGNVIVANTDKLNINKIRAFRKANQTCYQAHPGLCVMTPCTRPSKLFNAPCRGPLGHSRLERTSMAPYSCCSPGTPRSAELTGRNVLMLQTLM